MKRILSIIALLLCALPMRAAVYYTRNGGGTRFSSNVAVGQCTGLADVDYPGATNKTWQPNQTLSLGYEITDNTGNYETVTTAGTTANSAWTSPPTWGTTTTDGTVVWTKGATYPVDQPCAFGDVRYNWTDASFNNWGWVGTTGDTYLIRGGPWRIGQSGPNSGDYFGLSGNPYGSGAPAPPNGTTIEGENFSSCTASGSSPGNATQVFGGYAVNTVFYLQGTDSVTIKCLDISDHGDCVKAGSLNRCMTGYPLSDFADNGLGLYKTTTNLTLQNVGIHGMVSSGIFGPPGTGFNATGLWIIGNAGAGWNADPGDGTTGTGTMNITNYEISWSGCSEIFAGAFQASNAYILQNYVFDGTNYQQVTTAGTSSTAPSWNGSLGGTTTSGGATFTNIGPSLPALPYIDCTDDNSGGYGDGFGTATVPSSPAWNVHFDQGVVSYNTQDGLDALHLTGTGSSMTITRTLAYGNMGQQLKNGGANGTTVNNLIVTNCNALRTIPGTPSGFNSQLSDFCRAADAGMAMALSAGATLKFDYNTIYSASSTALELDCSGSCDSTTLIDYRNNVFVGFLNNTANGYPGGGTGDYSNPIFNGTGVSPFTNAGSLYANNATYHPKSTWTCPATGESNALCGDPQLTDETWHLYGFGNMQPTSGAAVIGIGTPISGITVDYLGATRNPTNPTEGAYEGAFTPPGTNFIINGPLVTNGGFVAQ